jgi:chorismate mutase/prephenate dehydratase
MDLQSLRNEIDAIDDEILSLFLKRMEISSKVADYKKENDLQTLQKGREREILNRVSEISGSEMAEYSRMLFSLLMDLSKGYQNKRNAKTNGELSEKIKKALKETPQIFPQSGTVACQGIEGAYSQIACERLFKSPDIKFVKSFEDVFKEVENGTCKYGILPIENSIHGTVITVYDLMKNYNFHIIKSIKMKINHVLMAHQGAKLSQIKEIISHEQALGQCSEFLREFPDIKITVCENTAMAAKLVADSERLDVAAISSPDCAEMYNLSVLNENIANSDSNFTRFICISKDLLIYPGADRISIIMNLPHTPGALNNTISKFAMAGLNLTKLESRPIAGRDFEFSFYFDLEASIYAEDTIGILNELDSGNNNLIFLGSYLQS